MVQNLSGALGPAGFACDVGLQLGAHPAIALLLSGGEHNLAALPRTDSVQVKFAAW